MSGAKELVSKSFKTVIEMLEDRGVVFDNIDKNAMFETLEDDFNKVAFQVLLPNSMRLIYHIGSKFKYSEIKRLLEDAEESGDCDLCILIINDNITATNVKQLAAHNVAKEIHHLKTLQINISKHHLVPKHEVLRDQDEIKRIMELYNLKSKHQLPIILKSDAMSKYMGLKSGDIVKITRKSPTSGEYIVYRVCI